MHEYSVNTGMVWFNNSQLTAEPFPSGLDIILVLILNGTACAAMCWATEAVKELQTAMKQG